MYTCINIKNTWILVLAVITWCKSQDGFESLKLFWFSFVSTTALSNVAYDGTSLDRLLIKTSLSLNDSLSLMFSLNLIVCTVQKIKFSIMDFFSKCDQIRSWSHLLKKFLIENFIFCAVLIYYLFLANVQLRIFPLRTKSEEILIGKL